MARTPRWAVDSPQVSQAATNLVWDPPPGAVSGCKEPGGEGPAAAAGHRQVQVRMDGCLAPSSPDQQQQQQEQQQEQQHHHPKHQQGAGSSSRGTAPVQTRVRCSAPQRREGAQPARTPSLPCPRHARRAGTPCARRAGGTLMWGSTTWAERATRMRARCKGTWQVGGLAHAPGRAGCVWGQRRANCAFHKKLKHKNFAGAAGGASTTAPTTSGAPSVAEAEGASHARRAKEIEV